MRTQVGARRRGPRSKAMLAVVALLMVGCSATNADDSQERISAEDEAPVPVSGGRLVVGVPMESNGWNPFMNQWGDAPTLVGTSMIEPLAIQDNDGTPRPWLAEKWEPRADFKEWDITLRPGVFFHDGTPFDAHAAKKSLDKLCCSGLYSIQYNRFYERVEVTGPMTVRVVLKMKWAQYPISFAYSWMLAPSMLDRPDEGTTAPVGTGPFRFQRWKQFDSLSAVRFDRYWRKDEAGRSLPYLNEVEFRVIDNAVDRAQGLRSGEVDLALSAGGDLAGKLGDEREFEVIKDYLTQRTYVMLNTATGAGNKGNPFNNVHARRALAYATDRRRIANTVAPDVEITTHPFRPDSPWAPAGGDGYVHYDPAIARKEIDLYKKDTGAKELKFTLDGPSATDMQTTMQAFRDNLAEVGITVTLNTVDPPKTGLVAAQGLYHASLVRTHDFPDPDQMSFYYSSVTRAEVGELSLNITRYTSPQLDASLKVLRESNDFTQRKAASDDLIRETNSAAIDIWLYNTPSSIVASRRVHGLDGFRTHAFANALPKPWLAETYLR